MVISRYSDYWNEGNNRDGDSLEAFDHISRLYNTYYTGYKDFLLRNECFLRLDLRIDYLACSFYVRELIYRKVNM